MQSKTSFWHIQDQNLPPCLASGSSGCWRGLEVRVLMAELSGAKGKQFLPATVGARIYLAWWVVSQQPVLLTGPPPTHPLFYSYAHGFLE